jgi:hypothetical protein
MKLAIIIGVSQYLNATTLDACKNDAALFHVILEKIKKLDDILFLGDSPNGHEAKKSISDFITKHKGSSVDELIFYYTGHGLRHEDDFFYLFSDFSEEKKETSGLRNTELDGFFRNISPKLTVKIVDACYSGGAYIKGEEDIQSVLKKSANESKLKDVYFMYSSRDDEASWAGKDYSYFSKSIFKSLTENVGEIRYRDVMAYIADDSSVSGYPKPVFIVQADNTELFGTISKELQEVINSKIKEKEKTDDKDSTTPNEPEKSISLLEIVKQKSIEEYCTESEAEKTLESIKSELCNTNNWPEDIISMFDIQSNLITNTEYIPNAIEIGRWVKKHYENGYFAKPKYETEIYEVEEYKELPQKPISRNHLGISSTIARMSGLFGGGTPEYRLETVEKKRQIICGFSLTHQFDYNAVKVEFIPKFNSISRYSLHLSIVYSRKDVAIHYSYEKLRDFNWKEFSQPHCNTWKNKIISLKKSELAITKIKDVVIECSSWIIEDIKQEIK